MLKPDNEFLTVNQVLRIIRKALEEKRPFSLVRIGDGENVVLAQDSAMPIRSMIYFCILAWNEIFAPQPAYI